MWYFLIIIVFASLWFISFLQDKRKLRNGFYFMLSYLFLVGGLAELASYIDSSFMYVVMVFLLGIPIVLVPLFLVLLINMLFVTAIKLLRNEGIGLYNFLGVSFGLVFIVWAVVLPLFLQATTPEWLRFTLVVLSSYFGYIFFMFVVFVVASLTYALAPKRKNHTDYIIVLGAGLLDGRRVSPLLASRIQRAIKQYQTQILAGRAAPMLIMSGGQGADELISEAEAMACYAIEQGIVTQHLYIEDRSTTTYENMLYSKELIEEQIGPNARGLFATNNYHVFRAALYARMVGLKAEGIGGPTKIYYFLNAFIREFVAILVMHKILQVCIFILILTGILAIYFLNSHIFL